MSNANINLKAGNHRLEFTTEGQFHCFLCNCVGWAEEIGDCLASEAERREFDDRYSLEPEIKDEMGNRLERGMMVAGIPESGDRTQAVRACKLIDYAHGTASPFITNKGAFRKVIKDHQPEMYEWIKAHVSNPEEILP